MNSLPVPITTRQARDSNVTILRVVYVMCAVIVALLLLVVYLVGNLSDAVQAQEKNSARTECRSNISTDTYQRYWRDVFAAIDASLKRDLAKVAYYTDDANSIPLIKRTVAAACAPALSDSTTNSVP